MSFTGTHGVSNYALPGPSNVYANNSALNPLPMQQQQQQQPPHQTQMSNEQNYYQPQQQAQSLNQPLPIVSNNNNVSIPQMPNCNSRLMNIMKSMITTDQLSSNDSPNGIKSDYQLNPVMKINMNDGVPILDKHRKNFNIFKTMNLEDEDSLNQLFLFNTFYNDRKFMVCKIENLYIRKYSQLYEECHLDEYTRVWVAGLLYNKLEEMRKFINNTQSNNSELISMDRTFFNFKVLRPNKRKQPSKDDSVTASAAINDVDEKRTKLEDSTVVDNVTASRDHPFYTNASLREKYECILNIGQYHMYLLPMSFAMFCIQPKIGNVIEYKVGNVQVVHLGGDMKFSTPVLGRAQVRKMKFNYLDLVYDEPLKTYVETIFDRKISWSSLSSRKTQEHSELTRLQFTQTSTLDVDSLIFAVFNNTAAFFTTTNEFKLRTFPQGLMTLQTDEWVNINNDAVPDRSCVQALKDYYNSLGLQCDDSQEPI